MELRERETDSPLVLVRIVVAIVARQGCCVDVAGTARVFYRHAVNLE